MRIGIPREIKILEGRVGLIPAACTDLVAQGHTVYLETTAGELSGYQDADYQANGVIILPDAATLYAESELIIKVKEPQPKDCEHLRADHLLFCYLHLAAEPELTQRLCEIGLTAVAFETVLVDGQLPLLTPMSVIAGQVAVQVGTHLLHKPQGGKGVLLGGLTATTRGNVVILGAGAAGGAAARLASALGANVTVFDKRWDRLETMRQLGANVTALYAFQTQVDAAVQQTDLVIGAVLLPGRRAPHVVSAETVAKMQAGSVIADISIDQGGCIATSRPTTYAQPTYVHDGVVHFCVTNMPGAVQRTASQALSAAVLPYAQQLAQVDWQHNVALREAVNVTEGKVVHPALLT